MAHTSIQMTSIEDFRLIIWAITEIISDLIWASDFFGSREIWSLRYLVPKTFWSPHENHYMTFSGRSQTSWGLNFLGPNFSVTSKFRGPNEMGDHFSYCHYLAWKYVEMCAMYPWFAECACVQKLLGTGILLLPSIKSGKIAGKQISRPLHSAQYA